MAIAQEYISGTAPGTVASPSVMAAQAAPPAQVSQTSRNIYAGVNAGAPLNSGATREANVQRAKDKGQLGQIASIYNAASAIETGSAPNQVIRMVMDPQTGAITRQVTDSRTGKPYQPQLTSAELARGASVEYGSKLESGYAGFGQKNGGYTTIAPDGTRATYGPVAMTPENALNRPVSLIPKVAPTTLGQEYVNQIQGTGLTAMPTGNSSVAAPSTGLTALPNSNAQAVGAGVLKGFAAAQTAPTAPASIAQDYISGAALTPRQPSGSTSTAPAKKPLGKESKAILNAFAARQYEADAVAGTFADAKKKAADRVAAALVPPAPAVVENDSALTADEEIGTPTETAMGARTEPAKNAMSPEAYRAAREKLGLSQQGQANREGVTLEEIKKREAK
jgi:DNA-binding transcriptional regulator YiaG